MRSRCLVPLVFAAVACAKTGNPAADSATQAAAAAAANDSAKAALAKLRDGWKEAANRKDATAVAAFYTDDATLVGTDIPIASGKDAILKAISESLPILTIDNIDSKETVVNGDVAYDYGTFKQTVAPPKQKTQTIEGYYLVALKKQSDGSWKIVHHLSTNAPPAPPATKKS